ncbi:uncharacterized protein LOC119333209 [Triticum dicoccoides]|uniref:uncharacterized protein LOC119333209 n=1 Tax=Triticum dicoccoides TaxID=85692 RepID=UPI000E7BA4AC|nr:uncharacterized protein LOC119333209 [Triticum dicoccoides]XP_044319721.1 uncharacterized protein LOC123041087 [Triticum aestivum]XP_044422090.1 uncharacterized protein LOC123146887 [Triticum aestivum]
MRWAYTSLLPSHWHYVAAATARTDGGLHRPPRERSSLGSSLHWQQLIFSPANCGLTDQVAGIGDHCLPRRQQQSDIRENNLTGRWRSLFQVSEFSNRRQLWSPPITCQEHLHYIRPPKVHVMLSEACWKRCPFSLQFWCI